MSVAIKKNRNHEIEDRNKRIKEMDMEEVKRYLCMKNMQNPDKCPECASLNTCNAGQRVIELINEKAKREKKKNKLEVAKKIAKKKRERTAEYIKEVLKTDNPKSFLMQNEGLRLDQATSKLKYWHKSYPELFEERTNAAIQPKEDDQGKEQTEEQTETNTVEEREEVSIEEFLNEMDTEPIAETEQPKTESRVNFSEVNACGVPIELIRKESELYTQMNKVEQQIKELQNKYNMLKKAQKAVSLTMTVFSDTSADFRQTLSMIDRYDKGE